MTRLRRFQPGLVLTDAEHAGIRAVSETTGYAHGYVQTARGMCVDEVPYEVLDQQLAEAVERVKDVEEERDALRESLAALSPPEAEGERP